MNGFFQNHPLPTFLYDLHSFALLAVNEAAIFQYGYSEHEFLSFTLAQLAVPAKEAHVERVRPRLPESIGGTRYTCTHRRKDGTLFDAEVVSRLIQCDSRWLEDLPSQSISQQRPVQDEAFSRELTTAQLH